MWPLATRVWAPVLVVTSVAAPAASSADVAVEIESARRSIEAGRYAEAEAALERVVARQPSSARAWALLGRARALDRRYQGAEPALERALELGATDPATLLLYGSTLWENGRLDEAERVLEEATRGAGDVWPARHQLASLWLWRGRFAQAVPLLEEIVGERPDWLGAHLDLARAYQGIGDWPGARREFEVYLAGVPRDPDARYGLAMVLRELGETQRAAREAATAAEIRRAEQEATLEQGRLDAELAQAVRWLREGDVGVALGRLAELPRSAPVLDVWSRALHAHGDLAGAIQRLEEAVGLDPSRRDLRTRLQELYLERGSDR